MAKEKEMYVKLNLRNVKQLAGFKIAYCMERLEVFQVYGIIVT